MTHDPRDVETMARLLCEAWGIGGVNDIDEHSLEMDARRALDALQWKGWKITAPTTTIEMADAPEAVSGTCVRTTSSDWACMHDAAPICPRGTP